MAITEEEKKENFTSVLNRRTQNIRKEIRKLSGFVNRGYYVFSMQEFSRAIDSIKSELDNVESVIGGTYGQTK